MPEVLRGNDGENERIVLGLLESVERDGAQSQRKLAADLGIALGLVNAYLKRCVKKGLVKVAEAPAHRYAYYLTPQGLSEKSRLTIQYLVHSFSFFRQAKIDCADAFERARARGFIRVAIVGVSDLAEIATICALEAGITIVAVVDENSCATKFVGVPVVQSFDAAPNHFDAVLVTDLNAARETALAAIQKFGAERVFVPALLGVRVGEDAGRGM